MSLKTFLPVVAAVIALATLGSGGTAAASPTDDPCMVGPADVTLWLGQDIPKVEANAYFNYGAPTRPCKHFVVDIQVPYNSSGGWGFTSAFSIEVDAAFYLPNCDHRRQWTFVYRKNAGQASLNYLGHVGLYGGDGVNCVMHAIPQHDDPWPSSFTPPNARVTTYRVLSTAWYGGWSWQPSELMAPRVRATHLRVL